jgi:adenosylcobyric acid synthase
VPGLWLDAEDSLDLAGLALDGVRPPSGEAAGEPLTVAVIALPRLSNVTDLDALAVEPGVDVRLVTRPGELEAADLAVLPGTRSTVADLAWLRACGLDVALHRRAAAGRPVLGICGGYQMLGHEIHDDVESRQGTVPGLGLLPVRIRFAADKTLARPRGFAEGEPVTGYEIHHGIVDIEAGEPVFTAADGAALDGCRVGAVTGTLWHGALENDGFRRAFLTRTAALAGRRFLVSPDTSFEAARQSRLDALGDLVADHLDNAAVDRLITAGATPGLPFVPPGA